MRAAGLYRDRYSFGETPKPYSGERSCPVHHFRSRGSGPCEGDAAMWNGDAAMLSGDAAMWHSDAAMWNGDTAMLNDDAADAGGGSVVYRDLCSHQSVTGEERMDSAPAFVYYETSLRWPSPHTSGHHQCG